MTASYLEWNDALAARFFSPEMAGQDVNLYVTADLVTELGEPWKEGVNEFVAAVKTGPQWATHEGICQKALQALEAWRARNLEYPPYLAYLSLFVLAAGIFEEDFAPHAYYPRLRQLLQLHEGAMPPSFDRMLELWDDLERWSTRDKNGQFGNFTARIAGGWIHVGLPIAQAILTGQERKSLPRVFALAALDPTAPPSDSEIARLLRIFGNDCFRRRTLDLLATRHDEDLLGVLLDTVRQALVDWDGEVVEGIPGEPVTRRRLFGALRLALSVDEIAGRVQARLRCRLNAEWPEIQQVVLDGPHGATYWFEEYLPTWSSPLGETSTGAVVDASIFDWTASLSLKNEVLGWQLRLPGSPVRLFVNGAHEGLPGLVEIHELSRSQPFYLLFRDDQWPVLEKWALNDCEHFHEYTIRQGLPAGWRFAAARGAQSDERVRNKIPVLSFSQRLRLRLVDGIRSHPGNNFFAFAPPRILLEGGTTSHEVYLGSHRLTPLPDTQLFELAGALDRDTKITIEVREAGNSVKRQALYLTGDFAWQRSLPLVRFNSIGQRVLETGANASGVAGALVSGEGLDTEHFKRSALLARHATDAGRTFLLGRRPGEIISWPTEPLAEDWEPIWAISMSRNGRAVYCGTDLAASSPTTLPVESKTHVRAWRELLWQKRKRITPPRQRVLRALWTRFQEAARDA